MNWWLICRVLALQSVVTGSISNSGDHSIHCCPVFLYVVHKCSPDFLVMVIQLLLIGLNFVYQVCLWLLCSIPKPFLEYLLCGLKSLLATTMDFWCAQPNGYCHKKKESEFKTWVRLFVFHFTLMPLGKHKSKLSYQLEGRLGSLA